MNRALALLAVVLCACVTPRQRDLKLAVPPAVVYPPTPGALGLRVLPPKLALPLEEIYGAAPTAHLLVPWPVGVYRETAGSLIPALAVYGPAPAEALRASIAHTLRAAGLFRAVDAGAAELVLESELVRLRGEVYHKSRTMVLFPELVSRYQEDFLPYGSAALRVRLIDTRGARTTRFEAVLSGAFLPDDSAVKLLAEELAEDAASFAAQQALVQLLRELPGRLAPVVRGLSPAPLPTAPPESFVIARLSPDRRHLERARVGFLSGQLSGVEVVARRVPPFATPGAWVLDPYQGGLVPLGDDAYAALGAFVARRYGVGRADDARVLRFYGRRRP